MKVMTMNMMRSENEMNAMIHQKNVRLLLTLVEKPYMTKTENLQGYIENNGVRSGQRVCFSSTSCVLHEGEVQVVDLVRVYIEGK
jgi:hypothetical protein